MAVISAGHAGWDGGRQHRLEQAVHAAVQGVVFQRLPVGAVRGLVRCAPSCTKQEWRRRR
jgi:hypothetical protein